MAPEALARVLKTLPHDKWASGRLLTGSSDNEDAAIVTVPVGKALVQTIDFFTPVVNDPYKFGQIAAANSLSDVYAMGGQPWCAMNVVCFPAKEGHMEILEAILQGGADKTSEAGAALAGGHSVEDAEIKFGLSVTGLVDPNCFARNSGLETGRVLIATKALGTGVLATAIKGRWEGHEEFENILYQSAARLNKIPGELIGKLKLKAATDITGFGLGGHLLEMLEASDVAAVLHASAINLLPQARELAAQGLLPEGSFANRSYRSCMYQAASNVDPLIIDLIFDAQTSGGMLLAVSEAQVAEALAFLENNGEIASAVGEVVPHVKGQPRLMIMS
jgi:selenide,water dikinase